MTPEQIHVYVAKQAALAFGNGSGSIEALWDALEGAGLMKVPEIAVPPPASLDVTILVDVAKAIDALSALTTPIKKATIEPVIGLLKGVQDKLGDA